MKNIYKFLNIGFGDTFILYLRNKVVMVDCFEDDGPGGPYEKIARHLPGGVVDALILTHRHFDHYYGIQALLDNNIRVGEVWESSWQRRPDDTSIDPEQWQKCGKLVDRLTAEGTKIHGAVSSNGPFLIIGGSSFYALNPTAEINNDETSGLHDGCLVVLMSTPDNPKEIIFSGDATRHVLGRIAKTRDIANIRILCASHHGALDSANEEYLMRVSPDYTVISNSAYIIQSGIYQGFTAQEQDEAYQIYQRHTKIAVKRTFADGTVIIGT